MVLPADPGDGGQPASARRPNGRVNHMLAHCHKAGGGHGASSPPLGCSFVRNNVRFFVRMKNPSLALSGTRVYS